MPQKKVSATINVTAVIDGQDGQPGADGNGIQSVARTYAVSSQATTVSDTTPPSDVTTWAAASPATTEAKPYLWAKEVVTYTKTASTTKYYMIGARGQNGIDAQDFEWAYIRTKTNTAPVIAADSSYTDSKGKAYTADDHLPHVTGNSNIESNNSGVSGKTYECTDDPKGVKDEWPYEWEIKREKGTADANGHRAWQPYAAVKMTLHNNLAESLLTIDIDNDSDQFGVDADGKVLAQQARSTVVTMDYGTEPQAFTSAPTASLRYDDGTTVASSVATAAVSDVSPSDAAKTQYRVTVTVKATGTAAAVFGTSGKNGLYVDISGTCAKGGPKIIRFSLTKVMGGASGESPVIWQLNPSQKSFVFGRDASNNLTPASVASNIYVTRTVGNTTTEHTGTSGLTNPPTFSWGFDSSSTAQASGQAIGTPISISNTQAANHSSVWVKLSTEDRETLPILKDGAKGADPVVLSLRCSAAVVSFKENSQGQVTCSPETYRLSLERTEGETTTVLNSVPSGYSLMFKEGVGGEWSDGQSLGELDAASEFFDGSISQIRYGLFKNSTLLQYVTVVAEWPEKGDTGEKGDKGDKGDDAVNYELLCSPAAVNFRSNAVGEFSGSYTVVCKVMKTIGDTTSEVTDSNGTYDGMYLKSRFLTATTVGAWMVASSRSIPWQNAVNYGVTGVEFALATDNNMTNVVSRVTIPVICDGHRGAQGEPGATGKMFYPMGEWNVQTTYSRTGDLVPLVFLPDPGNYNETIGAEGHYFYLYDDTNTGTRPVINDSTNPWRLCDTFGVVITQGLFAEFAKMGKGIFSGDYFFSMNGRIFTSATNSIEKTAGAAYTYNGVTKPAYTWFKGDPSEQTTYPYFEPNWWVDLLTGKMSAARGNFVVDDSGNVHLDNAYVRGEVRAGLLYKNVKRIRPNVFEDGNLRTGCSYGTNTAGVPYYTYSAEALIEDCDGIMPAILIFYSYDVALATGADFIRSAEAGGYRMDVELPPAADWQGLEVLVCVQGKIKQSSKYYPNIVVNSYNDEGYDTLFMLNQENSIQYIETHDAYVEKGTYSTIPMYSVRLVSAYGNYGWKWTILENTENVRYNTWAFN